jgi:hypothetical protein
MAATEDDNDEPVDDCRDSACGNHMAPWFGWMALFGAIGVSVTIGIQGLVEDWCCRDSLRQSRVWMMEQADQLRRGETNCLVKPDPAVVEELLADSACAAKIRDLYLGGDLSDPRLGRLRELRNLKCVILLFARNQDVFLERLNGVPMIEELTVSRTFLSRSDIARIATFPNLKWLAIAEYPLHAKDLDELAGHRSLERLAIDRATSEKELVPLLKSLPRLREFSISIETEKGGMSRGALQNLLDKALPRCKCHVLDGGR